MPKKSKYPDVYYSDIRNDLKDFDIILFKGNKLVSKLIRWGTGSSFSHIGLVMRLEPDAILLFESTDASGVLDHFSKNLKNGVQTVSLSTRIATYKGEVFYYPLSGPRTADMAEDFQLLRKELSGLKYERNILELVGAAWHSIKNRENRASLFCSECAAYVLKKVGILCANIPSNEYTPEDFSPEADGTIPLCKDYKLGPTLYRIVFDV